MKKQKNKTRDVLGVSIGAGGVVSSFKGLSKLRNMQNVVGESYDRLNALAKVPLDTQSFSGPSNYYHALTDALDTSARGMSDGFSFLQSLPDRWKARIPLLKMFPDKGSLQAKAAESLFSGIDPQEYARQMSDPKLALKLKGILSDNKLDILSRLRKAGLRDYQKTALFRKKMPQVQRVLRQHLKTMRPALKDVSKVAEVLKKVGIGGAVASGVTGLIYLKRLSNQNAT